LATTNLDKIFHPKSIALIGATDREGSVGLALMKNLTELKYGGTVYPINIQKKEVLGFKAYKTVEQLPETVDMAIVAIPAKAVHEVVEQCGKAGILGIIIISAGFKEVGAEGKALEEKILEIQKKYNLRILGPNCGGVIRPSIGLNATFAKMMPKPGKIAFISQSGSLSTAILNWALHQNIGFSSFVSVGSMVDVCFGDLIDYFGADPETRSILLYLEGLTNARDFISATRHFARTKPILVLKAGKFSASARAAASHTGSLTSEDEVYTAAFKRAGIMRVEKIADLFNCAEVLGMQPLPEGPNLAIVTNAGGPGVMATDAIIAKGGSPFHLSQKTMKELNSILPPYWSRGNPIDILGDATAERYSATVEACLKDEDVNGLLLIYAPQIAADSAEIVRNIVDVCKRNGPCKTMLTAFMGHKATEEANRIFTENNIPTYATPEQAIEAYLCLYQYKRNLELLYETPGELPLDSVPSKRPLTVIMKNAAKENREILNATEAKSLLEYYHLPLVETVVARTPDEAAFAASQIGYPVVLKILSPQIPHKSEAGGVVLDINSKTELREAYDRILHRAKEYNPEAEMHGVTVQRMIKKPGYEVMLGAKTDPLFGPVILFGRGGVGVDLFRDVAVGLPPLTRTLARRIMEETKIYQLLKGYRHMPPANLKLLEEKMVYLSQLLVDFPQIQEVDINPLFIDETDAFALDARVVIDKALVFAKAEARQHLVISSYPKKYETWWKLRDGRTILLRPIKPEDEPLWLQMFQTFSERSIRHRFFHIIKDTSHAMRVRYCNIDYDREIAIVAELRENGQRKIIGVVRVPIEPDKKTGEIAVIVADPWQGLGLGSKMIDHMIEICKDKQLETLYGIMMPKNSRAIRLMREMGFTIQHFPDIVKAVLNLKEEPRRV
jgi:acetyltransferase